MNSTPNPAIDKIIASSYDRDNDKFIVNTSDTTSSVLIVGDDYSGADPPVHHAVYVDADGFLTANVLESEHDNIYLGFDEYATAMTTGSTASWSKTNPYASDQDGWYTTNLGNLSSLLWYNNGSYGTQQAFNFQSEFTFADIDIWYMVIRNYRPLATSNGIVIMPTIRIYSKPTGTGDVIAGLCHSFWDYTFTTGQELNFGEAIMIYNGLTSRVKTIDVEARRVGYTLSGGSGDRATTEVIKHIAFIYDTANLFQTLVVEAGLYIKNKGLINYYFTNGNTSKSQVATIAMKTATDTINTSTSAINTKLTGLTITSNRLQADTAIVDGTTPAKRVETAESGGVYHLLTADIRNTPFANYGQILTNQTIFSGNASQATLNNYNSYSYRKGAQLAWSDNGSAKDISGISVYGAQGFSGSAYLGTLFPIYDAYNGGRLATFNIDPTKFDTYTFLNLSSSTLSCNCYIISS